MEVGTWVSIGIGVASMAITIGINFGIIKEKLSHFLTFEKHQEICHSGYESVMLAIKELKQEFKDDTNILFDRVKQISERQERLIGHIEGSTGKTINV